MIIWAGTGQRDLVYDILTSKPFVQIGKFSYAWYLWHWPIMVLAKAEFHGELGMLAPYLETFCVLLSLGLAALSYYYIEQPVREGRAFVRSATVFTAFTACFLTSLFLSVPDFVQPVENARILLTKGKAAPYIAQITKERANYTKDLNTNFTGKSGPYKYKKKNRRPCSFNKGTKLNYLYECLVQQSGTKNVLVLGDSVGSNVWRSLRKAFPNRTFIMIHESSCTPGYIKTKRKRLCFKEAVGLIKRIKKKIQIDTLIFSFRFRPNKWKVFDGAVDELVNQFDTNILIGVTPSFRYPLAKWLTKVKLFQPIPASISEDNRKIIPWSYKNIVRQAKEISKKSSIIFIDVEKDFCPKDHCLIWKDGDFMKPLFVDAHHLSRYGIAFLANKLKANKVLSKALK